MVSDNCCRATKVLVVLSLLTISIGAGAADPEASNGEVWDVQRGENGDQDSGAIGSGGASYPFNGFGYLKLRIPGASDAMLARGRYLEGFGLVPDGDRRFDSLTPLYLGGVVASRGLYVPEGENYLRYVDRFTNMSGSAIALEVVYGGAIGSYADGGYPEIAVTSDGDQSLEQDDHYVVFMQNLLDTPDPVEGPSGYGPSAHVFSNANGGSLVGFSAIDTQPFDAEFPDPAAPQSIGFLHRLTLRPGETKILLHFVVKGKTEAFEPGTGFPVFLENAGQTAYFKAVPLSESFPDAGREIDKVTVTAKRLAATPDLAGLTPREVAAVANWRVRTTAPVRSCRIVEQRIRRLRECLINGGRAGDVVRDYLVRIAAYDRNGPGYSAYLALNPNVFHVARALDQKAAQGDPLGVLHGVPVALKDNINTADMPTSSGSRALSSWTPATDAFVTARLRAAGAIILGKTNLDELALSDYSISTVGGRTLNAYDPSKSAAGSSGGSAVAVAANLAMAALGTDTLNSLTNPASWAGLVTLRPSYGLVGRSGIAPLSEITDVAAPMTRSVEDLALLLDVLAGPDPDDPATQSVGKHRQHQQYAAALGSRGLDTARIGVFRQRFLPLSLNPEIGATVDRALADMARLGATLIDVEINGYDELVSAALDNAPADHDRVLDAYFADSSSDLSKAPNVQGLLDSGFLPEKIHIYLEKALRTDSPSPAEVEVTMQARRNLREEFLKLLDAHDLDAIIYPAATQRPEPLDAGRSRYGFVSGTTEESALTGLPHVTVQAGWLGGVYPVGMNMLGRMYDEHTLLSLAHAFEEATRYRGAPTVSP